MRSQKQRNATGDLCRRAFARKAHGNARRRGRRFRSLPGERGPAAEAPRCNANANSIMPDKLVISAVGAAARIWALKSSPRLHSMHKSRKEKAPRDRVRPNAAQITIDTEGAGALVVGLSGSGRS